jgi:hypothetical protein
MSNDDWTDDIEEILTKVRQNCIDMYKYHLCRYFQYKTHHAHISSSRVDFECVEFGEHNLQQLSLFLLQQS